VAESYASSTYQSADMSAKHAYSIGYPYKIFITITSTSSDTGDFLMKAKFVAFDTSTTQTREEVSNGQISVKSTEPEVITQEVE
jgi:hypothetical protein